MGEVLGKSLGEAKGDLLEKKYNFYKAREVAVKMKEYIMELTSWVVVGTEMRSIIAACALLLGFKKESVYMKKKDGLWWQEFERACRTRRSLSSSRIWCILESLQRKMLMNCRLLSRPSLSTSVQPLSTVTLKSNSGRQSWTPRRRLRPKEARKAHRHLRWILKKSMTTSLTLLTLLSENLIQS